MEDPEFIDMLEALGYLAEDGTSAGAAAAVTPAEVHPTPGTVAPQQSAMTQGQLNNLAVIKINEKKYDEGERLLRQAIAENPKYASPHYNLRRAYIETGQYERADKELWTAIDKGFRDPERTLDRAAADYENLGMPDRAEAILVRAIERFPEHEPFYVHLMVLRVRDGRFAEALPVGEVAAEKFPESGPVHAFYGLAAASAGQTEVARREIELSLAINPNQPALKEALEQLP
jgi:tetratricopeptide (TPR) repeat protein